MPLRNTWDTEATPYNPLDKLLFHRVSGNGFDKTADSRSNPHTGGVPHSEDPPTSPLTKIGDGNPSYMVLSFISNPT